ncbi:MAG: hypothetical protein RIR73_1108 [Chloroflexota bacterium]|jgi:hypothetical protein
MSTVYLHVGPHKTGTTYLQYLFATQAKSLEQQGILYPSVGRGQFNGHHNIAWFLANIPFSNVERSDLSKSILKLARQDQGNILLSSEEFSKLDKFQLMELRKVFWQKKFHVLYFKRNGTQLIISLWQEIIKSGSTRPLNKATENVMKTRHHKYDPFAHEANILRYKRGLRGEVSVFNYNNLISNKLDLSIPIAEVLNIKLQSERIKINTRFSSETIELIRAANLYSRTIDKYLIRKNPGQICLKVMKIPFLGNILKKHVNDNFAKLQQILTPQDFLNMGYQSSSFLGEDQNIVYKYIPGDIMLDALNQKNILPWKIIKIIIKNNISWR